jgi:inorganic triphosphatase YgiF
MTKVEVEAKFEIPDRSVFDRLLAVERLAGLAVGEQTIKRVTDHYLDTPDWMILAAGYACRVRDGEAERVLTLKSVGHMDGAVQRRDEYEAPLDPDAPIWDKSRWPAGPARTLAEKAAADKPLEIHLTLRQTRHVCPLLDRDRLVAELSLDEVRFEDNDLIFELEVELPSTGTVAELDQIARVLEDEWKLTPASLSKLERGLQIRQKNRQGLLSETEQKRAKREKTKYPDIRPDDPMNKAGRKTLRLHFERMLAHKAGTQLGEDIEELHDMRVATRRMRAAFRLFSPYFDPKTIQPYLKGLRQIGRALGPVRDLDVFEDKAQQYLATLPTGQADVPDGLLAAWQIERVSAREQMCTTF